MSQLPPVTARNTPSDHAGGIGQRAGVVPIGDELRSRLMWIALLAPLVITLTAIAVITYLLVAPSPVTIAAQVLVLSAAGLITLIAILWAVSRAAAAAREAHGDLSGLRAMIPRGPEDLQVAIERWRRGERPQQVEPPGREAPEVQVLAYELDRFRVEAVDAVARASVSPSAPQSGGTQSAGVDERIGVFVNLARRLQSLVQREIQLLDDLESEVEDPDLLKGLFAVDHLATRIRRHAENLAVLGGAVSHRQWSRPVNTYVVLRSAVAEVEQYARVKLVRPIDGTLKGHAVADVIHLVAELVENAATFSNPSTQVLLRAQNVTAGIALEVEDRGLGMPREDQNRLNGMLASPGQVDITELLDDGRIGLFVVSTLARRHGIAVQLQTNIYGGVQAVIVLPHSLLGETGPAEPARSETPPRLEEPPSNTAPQSQSMPKRPVVSPPAPEANPAPPPAPAPASLAPISASPVSPAPVSGPPTESAPIKRPRPYVGRNSGADGVPTVSSPESQPGAERRPEPAMSAAEPVSPAYSADARPQPQRVRAAESPIPELSFGTPGGMSSGLFDSGNPNETTGVIHGGPATADQTSTSGGAADGGLPGPQTRSPGNDPTDPRPQLPQRRRQTHLVAELREAPPAHEQNHSEHDPGLMSAFQRGANRATPASEGDDVRVDGATNHKAFDEGEFIHDVE